MGLERRVDKLEVALIPPPEQPGHFDAWWQRSMERLAEAMAEILALEAVPTVDELQDHLDAAGIGRVERHGPDPIGRAVDRARAILAQELGIEPGEVTLDVAERVLRGDDER